VEAGDVILAMAVSEKQLLRKLFQDAAGRALIEQHLTAYTQAEKQELIKRLIYTGEDTQEKEARIRSASELLSMEFPETAWVIPGLLPVGLTILAGAPKVGKSWLALQIVLAVVSEGSALGSQANPGSGLYLALEDSPRRLKDRMILQSWQKTLQCDFILMRDFQKIIGYLDDQGMENLERLMEAKEYKLIVIDTLSRAIRGDQNDVGEMTEKLSPLQEIAHRFNCAIMVIDHHNKVHTRVGELDAIGDILGSTAKGAICDTAFGLYKERNQTGAKIMMIGKELEENTLDIRWVGSQGKWELEEAVSSEPRLSQSDLDILNLLENYKGRAVGVSMIANGLGRGKGAVQNQLRGLELKGKVKKIDKQWQLAGRGAPACPPPTSLPPACPPPASLPPACPPPASLPFT
jgi:succinate dehydrogenase flavin-adding protein (antitoxin of CptAB toxin-antitoxin module)